MEITASLQPPPPPSWTYHRSRRPQPPRPAMLLPLCALSKQGQQFFTSLATSAADPSAVNRLVRKFIASSSKSVALNAISHILSPNSSHHPRLSSLALPLYDNISKAPWFEWNPKLIADVIALLYKRERFEEAETLNSEAIAKLEPRERELCSFYCNLIDSHSKHKSNAGVFDSYERLKKLQSRSSSIYIKKRAYESMISSLCALDLPKEAENLMVEMMGIGLKLSVFEYRSVIYAYGRLGLFEKMTRIVCLMEGEGFKLDVVCTNMVLSSLGTHGKLTEMVPWVKRIKELGIPFSVRTYNSVLNSCPTIMSIVQDLKTCPLSLEELLENLLGDEAALVQELMGSSVLAEAMEWNSSELKLDLHGMHLGSAYLIMLQWFKELQLKFLAGNEVVPAEVVLVCGSGKHSTVRGESPVKGLVREMIARMKSPLRIDRKNNGCFIAKGKIVRDWLC